MKRWHNQCSSTRERLNAVKSLKALLDLMGGHYVNTYKVKLFSTIKLILSQKFHSMKAIMGLNIQVLMSFIELSDDSFLSCQLLTISALTLPLIHLWPRETQKLFRQLVLKNKSKPMFELAFKHLYFIPECNELKEVTDVLKPYITYGTKSDDIFDYITLVVNNINHENSR